ncbi:pilus assembly protein PilL [Pantoea sp. B9002]|uniref:pilus assembly protein PilL n=1 Tax=Pantoea sp. B9002 TaxID=2726979 RepID=UPI002107325F|nr:pilus assembly protein PilL [Pantoea sp. B9002]
MTTLIKISAIAMVLLSGAAYSAEAPRPITKSVETTTRTTLGSGYNTRAYNYGAMQPLNSANDIRQSQIDLTTVSVRTVWPEDAKTVKQASQYILDTIGYRLVTEYPAPSDANKLADQKIPPIAKVHRTMPIIDVLQMLIGFDNYVVVDHAHKLVSFTKRSIR